MQISLSDTGKRFNRDWIFRKLSCQLQAGEKYAITGPNGSGKSTLLQIIAGAVTPSEGTVTYHYNDRQVDPTQIFRHVALAAPYQEVIEEMTLLEFLEFHKKFKPLTKSIEEIITAVHLQKAAGKQIRYFSSGMKQRVKLAQAFFSAAPCLLLDEPCSNLDEDGFALYRELISNHTHNRTVIVSSNDPQEYEFCKNVISIVKYKS